MGSAGGEAAVDHQALAGDEAAGVGRQQEGRAHELVGVGGATQQRGVGHALLRFGGLARTMSVSTVPGASAFTRMPSGANSAAIERVYCRSPAFALAYIEV